jgi:hypothetical protein
MSHPTVSEINGKTVWVRPGIGPHAFGFATVIRFSSFFAMIDQ